MLRTFHIKGFRALADFSMNGLGRLNLLVGTNNCGKTSILEAVQLWVTHGAPQAFAEIAQRRGELGEFDSADAIRRVVSVEVKHLFSGHVLSKGAAFTLSASALPQKEELVVQRIAVKEANGEGSPTPELLVRFRREGDEEDTAELSLTSRGELRIGPAVSDLPDSHDGQPSCRFVGTGSLDRLQTISLFEEITLTPEEDVLYEALRTIEPNIERIASIGGSSGTSRERGGILVKSKGSATRIPIGTMGEGMWRMLGIALSLLQARGGVLLVDEIDSGLHFTVLDKLWKLVLETARRLDVQVFATTHSLDCVTSLAALCQSEEVGADEVSIQRIERDKRQAVAFSRDEIIIAASRGMEIR